MNHARGLLDVSLPSAAMFASLGVVLEESVGQRGGATFFAKTPMVSIESSISTVEKEQLPFDSHTFTHTG